MKILYNKKKKKKRRTDKLLTEDNQLSIKENVKAI